MPESQQREFSGIRGLLWPIHRHELKKLLPLLIMAFLITFSYNILRPLKDTVVMKAPGASADVIPFVKVWVMLPTAVLVSTLFAWLSRHLSREHVFYALMSLFLGFYCLFIFVLRPCGDIVHAHALADWLGERLPEGAHGFVTMVRYWSLAVFYAMCELWGSAVYFLLFWSFVNEITKVAQAKRFYAILGMGSHISGIFAGETGLNYAMAGDESGAFITELMILVLISGLLTVALFFWTNRYVLSDSRHYEPEKAQARQTKRLNFTFRESVAYLANSPYLRNLAIIVLTYNIAINLTEVVWKDQVSQLYPGKSEFHAYTCRVTTILGIVATLAALFFAGNFIKYLGWTKTAMMTPLVLFGTTIMFFGVLLFPEISTGLLPTVVLLGTTQNIMSRGAKYTVYDATKELAFTPLSDVSKLKGKTAIDGVGTRLGKSGGSAIYQLLFIVCGGLANSVPYVGLAVLLLVGVWMVAVRKLGIGFNALTDGKTTEAEANEAILNDGHRPIPVPQIG